MQGWQAPTQKREGRRGEEGALLSCWAGAHSAFGLTRPQTFDLDELVNHSDEGDNKGGARAS